MSFYIFNSKSKLLPAFCQPYNDEFLGSWLTRLSFDHGLSRSKLLALVGATGTSMSNWGVDRFLTDQKIGVLTDHTNCSYEDIKRTTLRHYENNLFLRAETSYVPSIWIVRSRRPSWEKRFDNTCGTLYCPMCFTKREVPVYYKKQWRLTLSFVCTDCNCYLRDFCPHCKNGATTMNVNEGGKNINEQLLTCGTCKKDISECDPQTAPKRILEMQKKFNAQLEGKLEDSKNAVEYYRVLYRFICLLTSRTGNAFDALIQNAYEINAVVNVRSEIASACLRSLSLNRKAEIFYVANWLVEEWPVRFVGLCNQHNLSSEQVLSYFTGMPAWFNEPLCNQLESYDAMVMNAPEPQQDLYMHSALYDYKCSREFDYDENPDEHYYNTDGLPGYNKYRNRNDFCANDILIQQLKKGMNMYQS